MPKVPDIQPDAWVRFRRDALLPLDSDPEEVKRLKRLTLTLALIFNDLKAIEWAAYQLRKDQPSDPIEPTAYNCELFAMRTTFSRYTAGVLAELGQVIDRNRSLVESTTFKDATLRVPPAAQTAWKIIVAFHERDDNQPQKGRTPALREPLTKYIREVRNKAAFHYGHDDDLEPLMNGLSAHLGKPASAANASLEASLGNETRTSRFYFADDAVKELIEEISRKYDFEPKQLGEFTEAVNIALRFVVDGLLRHFAGEPRFGLVGRVHNAY